MWISIDVDIDRYSHYNRHRHRHRPFRTACAVSYCEGRAVQPIVRVRVRHVVDLPLKDECRHCIC
jgi:hypothetical protein